MGRIIGTSEVNWLDGATKYYSEKIRFTFIDHANLCITEKNLKSAINLTRSARTKSDKTWKSIARVLAGIDASSIGIYIIGLAIVNPEPTTKLGLLVGGGPFLVLTGSLGIFYSLGVTFNLSSSSVFGRFEVNRI